MILSDQTEIALTTKYSVDYLEHLTGDTNLKKNQTFIKKLKAGIKPEQEHSIIEDIRNLKSTKFLDEIVSSILAFSPDKFKKAADIKSTVQVSVSLFEKYQGAFLISFEKLLLQCMTLSLDISDPLDFEPVVINFLASSSLSNLSYSDKLGPFLIFHRGLFKLYMECWQIGLFGKSDLMNIFTILKSFFQSEKEFAKKGENYYLTLLEQFVKNYHLIIFDSSTEKISTFFYGFYKDLIFTWLQSQYSAAKTRLVALDKQQYHFYNTRGDLSEEQKQKRIKLSLRVQQLEGFLNLLSSLLSIDISEFLSSFETPEDLRSDSGLIMPSLSMDQQQDVYGTGFDTLIEKDFYEAIPDLSSLIKESLDFPSDDEMSESESIQEPISTMGKTFSSFLERLKTVSSKDQADKLAVEYCFMNNKTYRKRLALELKNSMISDFDYAPFYCRFLANIKPLFPVLIENLMKKLVAHYKGSLYNLKSLYSREKTSGMIKILCECVKFHLLSHTVLFLQLKSQCEEFFTLPLHPDRIELFCLLLESIGPYFAKRIETRERLALILDQCQQKKKFLLKGKFPNYMNYISFLDSACIQCTNLSVSESSTKPIDYVLLYFEKLLQEELCPETMATIQQKLLLLPWKTHCSQLFYYFQLLLVQKTWEFKFSQTNLIAKLFFNTFSDQFPFLLFSFIEDMILSMKQGLSNSVNASSYQQTLSLFRFFGECYLNFASLNFFTFSQMIQLLYSILVLGHELHQNFPMKCCTCTADPPLDFFRIRIISILLPLVYTTLPPLASEKFLIFFQYYILTKAILPTEVEYLVMDLFELICPRMKIYTSAEEALAIILSWNKEKVSIKKSDPVSMAKPQPPLEVKQELLDPFDFEKEYLLMFHQESSIQKPIPFDIPVPLVSPTLSTSPNNVPFTVLLKKKNKQQLKSLSIPESCPMVTHTKLQKQTREAERKEIVSLILKDR